jgi:hypothetical protein
MRFLLVMISAFATANLANASVFTRLSPLGGGTVLIPAVTEVGGIVFHAKGLNGNILTSQLAASSLFSGFANVNPFVIGTQAGYTNAVLSGLGGGLSEVAVRVTLDDGDTGVGDFDEDGNFLRINGFGNANFSDVVTQRTTSVGVDIGVPNVAGGFRNNLLDTGFFYFTDPAFLTSLYGNLVATETLVFELNDTDLVGDNFFDFTGGVDGGLINIGTGPVVTPGVIPEPSTAVVFGLLSMVSVVRLRSRKRTNV